MSLNTVCNTSVGRLEVMGTKNATWNFRDLANNWVVRRKIRQMTRLDDHMLDDIGVTRDELEWAGRLPLTINSAHALKRRARLRKASLT